jgi:hypothetical protein
MKENGIKTTRASASCFVRVADSIRRSAIIRIFVDGGVDADTTA